jgi:hypothetical protein
MIDFRTNSGPDGHSMRRVFVYYRESDRKVVSVFYWKMEANETFSQEEMSHLAHLSSGQGNLIMPISGYHDADGEELEITTADRTDSIRTR